MSRKCYLLLLAAVAEYGLTRTLVRSGSTKTGLFHGLHQRLAHAADPPHYETKAEIEHTALLPNEWPQGWF